MVSTADRIFRNHSHMGIPFDAKIAVNVLPSNTLAHGLRSVKCRFRLNYRHTPRARKRGTPAMEELNCARPKVANLGGQYELCAKTGNKIAKNRLCCAHLCLTTHTHRVE